MRRPLHRPVPLAQRPARARFAVRPEQGAGQGTYPLPLPIFYLLKRTRAQNYRLRYWNDAYFTALEKIDKVAQKHNLTMGEVALRWMNHHSLMKREYDDAVIIGASSKKHIEEVCSVYSPTPCRLDN